MVCCLSQLLHASKSDNWSNYAIVEFKFVVMRCYSIIGSMWHICYSYYTPRNSAIGMNGGS